MENYAINHINEHLHSEGWRMKNWMFDAFTGAIWLFTGGLKFHIHNYTVINIPSKVTNWKGMNPSKWAYTPKFMCRCGHVLADGHEEIDELFYRWNREDYDVNSLYMHRAFGWKKGQQVVIATTPRAGKSQFMKMYQQQCLKDKQSVVKLDIDA